MRINSIAVPVQVNLLGLNLSKLSLNGAASGAAPPVRSGNLTPTSAANALRRIRSLVASAEYYAPSFASAPSVFSPAASGRPESGWTGSMP